MKPGDVVVGILVGAQETKVRPAVVIASATYLAERPDAVVGILTTKLPEMPGTTDYVLQDWQPAGLRAESCFRVYVLTADRSELSVIAISAGATGMPGHEACQISRTAWSPLGPPAG